jgi:hypothetical protein
MARVCFSVLLLMALSACAAEQNTQASAAQPDSMLTQAKGVLACTGLPVGGQKCALEEQKQ